MINEKILQIQKKNIKNSLNIKEKSYLCIGMPVLQ